MDRSLAIAMLISPTINSVHGRLFYYTGTNPTAGNEISETVPARRRWRILGIRLSFITDVNVIERRVVLILNDGTTSIHLAYPSATQTASLTRYYNYSNISMAPFFNISQYMIPLAPFILPAGSRILTVTNNIQAGDDYGAPLLLIEEWIDP